jgi:hypothetical protein
MPPSSISSAIALVGLCSLAAIETGGCSNSSKSLASVTRSGLPLLTAWLRGPIGQVRLFKISDADAAQQSRGDQSNVQGSHDVGLGTISELAPHCGRYEFKPDGGLLVWDAFVSYLDRKRVAATLTQHDHTLSWTSKPDGSLVATRQFSGRTQQLEIRAKEKLQLPDNCSRPLPNDTQSVVLVVQGL